ncbi:hypothetical protein ACH47Z_38865 [Streptomyces sp. NPDC020192]|uniref:hypothetical protein n=1 Tax=Streptomyces sp. NPDC020192 TaxID=3365066 RepID=UPI0037BD9C79
MSRLAEALALDPGRREQLLAAARTISAPARSAVVPDTGRPRPGAPCQLPYDTRLFTGRARELDQLLAPARSAPAGSASDMMVISAIDGMGGVGTSALAIRAGHRVRAQFADGQLFVDLHGHTAGIAPVTPADALDRLLRSLGVAPHRAHHTLISAGLIVPEVGGVLWTRGGQPEPCGHPRPCLGGCRFIERSFLGRFNLHESAWREIRPAVRDCLPPGG